MALVTITKAAQLAQVSRGTIYNKIEEGILSKGAEGIDTADLLRVFGTLHDVSNDDKSARKKPVSDGDSALSGVMARQNDEFTRGLMDQLEQAATDKEWLRELAESREKQALEAQEKLNELIERNNDLIERHADERQTWTAKLDEMQKRLPAPEDLVPKPRKKLFGLF